MGCASRPRSIVNDAPSALSRASAAAASIVTLNPCTNASSSARSIWLRCAPSTCDGTRACANFGASSRIAEDAALPAEPTAPFGGFTLAINLETPDAVDAAMAEAQAAGASLLLAAEKVEWGGYRGYVGDPDGHPWEIAHNPFIEIKADGSLDLR